MKRGFTLIELLVVIAIIGLLASIVLASLAQARARARYASAITQMQQLSQAAEFYNALNGSYPPDVLRDTNPGFTTLSSWPTPPCGGFTYDWDSPPSWPVTRITLRDQVAGTAGSGVYYYCIVPDPATGSCNTNMDSATPIQNVVSKSITCSE